MKDFENDLIYYPNPDPVKEPRFILKSVDGLEKSTKYSVTCNGTERVVYHTDSFDYVVVVDNEAVSYTHLDVYKRQISHRTNLHSFSVV